MIKHATAGAFVFCRFGVEWKLGLIEHPRLGRWMVPGGHVEAVESQAQAALREVHEETGLAGVRLVEAPAPVLPAGFPPTHVRIPQPWWITEMAVPADNHLAEPHVHIDHQYLAIADHRQPVSRAAHPFAWWGGDEVPRLPMFADTRVLATVLFDSIGDIADGDLLGSALCRPATATVWA